MFIKRIKGPIDDNALNNINHNFGLSDVLRTQINDLVLDSGESNAEVAQARGGHQVLSDRLNETDQQLADKAEKDEVFSMVNMGQDIKEAMTGGSVAIVGKNAVLNENIVDKQVSWEKTDFIEVASNNLFNKHDVLVNSRLSASGNIQSYSNGDLSHFIPVTPNAEYTLRSVLQYALYDSAREFITLADSSLATTITTPANAYYLRVVVAHTRTDLAAVTKGSEVLPYDEFKIRVKGMVEPNLSALDEILSTITTENESWVI